MGKSCWRARLAIQQLFPIQILLIFLRFKLLPIPQTSDVAVLLFFFPALFISGIHKVPGIKLRVGRSCNQVLQRAYWGKGCQGCVRKVPFLRSKKISNWDFYSGTSFYYSMARMYGNLYSRVRHQNLTRSNSLLASTH